MNRRSLGYALPFLVAAAAAAHGQGYTVETFPKGMTAVSGGTTLWNGASGTYDDATAQAPLGFTFRFFGASYTSCYVSTNGFLSFSPLSAAYYSNNVIPDAQAPNNYVALFWDDLVVSSTGDRVTYKTEGSSPNRVFVLEYFSVSRFNAPSAYLYGQIRLYETTNVIELHYATSYWVSMSATIGIENAGGTAGVGAPNATGATNTEPSVNYRFRPAPVRLRGTLQYEDRAFVVGGQVQSVAQAVNKPVRYADFTLVDGNGQPLSFSGQSWTTSGGAFDVTVPGLSLGATFRIRVLAQTAAATVTNSSDAVYAGLTPLLTVTAVDQSLGTITFTTASYPGLATALNLLDTAIDAYQYADGFTAENLPTIKVRWTSGDDGNSEFYPGGFLSSPYIKIADSRRWSHSSLLHEYGHYVMSIVAVTPGNYDATYNPLSGTTTPETAWSEGWAFYYGTAVAEQYYGNPTYVYASGETLTTRIDYEALTVNGSDYDGSVVQRHPASVARIAALLRDLHDGANEPNDGFGSAAAVFQRLDVGLDAVSDATALRFLDAWSVNERYAMSSLTTYHFQTYPGYLDDAVDTSGGVPDNTSSNAVPVASGYQASKWISKYNDDWMRVSLAAPGSLAVNVSLSHANGDIDLYVTDSSSNIVGSSASTTNAESVTVSGLAAGTYYVRVLGYQGTVNNSYSISVTTSLNHSVGTPSTASGPTAGTAGVTYAYTTAGSGCTLGHSVSYSFSWGDGTSSPFGAATQSHAWAAAGSFPVTVRAVCSGGSASAVSGPLTVTITTPHLVATPATPAGTASGITGTPYSYTTGGASCSWNHAVSYSFSWGDGTSSAFAGASQSHAWNAPGSYPVSATARCAGNVSSAASPALSVAINAPHTITSPGTPTGPSAGTTGTGYSFVTGGGSCSLGHSLTYSFGWGDGTSSGFGAATQVHSWSSAGTYAVTALGRCSGGLTSSPSSSLSVSISDPHSVSTPSSPAGPNSGTTGTSYGYSAGGSSCTWGHAVSYAFSWGDGTSSAFGGASQSHAWAAAGTYAVTASARCSAGVTSPPSPALTVAIEAPHTVNSPATPSGPTQGNTGTAYTYATGGAACNQGHPVSYSFSWGDGSSSAFGAASQAYAWAAEGSYAVTARARCSAGLASGASGALNVTMAAPGSAGPLTVGPSTGMAASGPVGGPFDPVAMTYTLRNEGTLPLAWSAATTAGWLSVSPASGTLAAGETASVTVALTAAAGNLPAGGYTDTVTFSNATHGTGTTTRPASLSVGGLTVTPATDFTGSGPAGGPFEPRDQAYALSNSGGVAVAWRADASATWLTLSSTGGTLAPGGSVQVMISINSSATALQAGRYTAAVTFTNVTNGIGTASRQVALDVAGPANDLFDSRGVLSGPTASVTASNRGAGEEPGEPDHAGNVGGASLWWIWIAPADGEVTLSLAGSTFDTLIAVYTGDALAGLVPVAWNDNASDTDATSRVSFTATAGTAYRIAVDGANSGSGPATGAVSLDLSLASGPAPSPAPGAGGGGGGGGGCGCTGLEGIAALAAVAGLRAFRRRRTAGR
jgi:hypothetical protein